jgi:ElaB/YqjD/DUF883 family membrane-anchored ribosome-binding protein
MHTASTNHSSDNKSAGNPIEKKFVGQDLFNNLSNEMHFFLEEAETKIEKFAKSFEAKAASLESSAKLSTEEFKEFLHEGELWFGNIVKRLQDAAVKSETAIDTARVKAHLAKMDTQDRTTELVHRVNRFKSQVDALLVKTERETTEKLTRLSSNCHELKVTLESTVE